MVNAVLPGVVDTPMARDNLSPHQIDAITNATQFRRLPTLDDVASAVHGLCSATNTGITGQFITVDLGYSHGRVI
jgi:NAD(P)-dependent dehydrogenase (short-subunit alcohol dehydrogenase family)